MPDDVADNLFVLVNTYRLNWVMTVFKSLIQNIIRLNVKRNQRKQQKYMNSQEAYRHPRDRHYYNKIMCKLLR